MAVNLKFTLSLKVNDENIRRSVITLHGEVDDALTINDITAKIYPIWEAFYPVVAGSIEGGTLTFELPGSWENYHAPFSNSDLEYTGVLRWNTRYGMSFPSPIYVPAVNTALFEKGVLLRDSAELVALATAINSAYPPVQLQSSDGLNVNGLGTGKLAIHHYKSQKR